MAFVSTRLLLLVALIFLAATAAFAADEPEWYEVEVIIFAHRAPDVGAGEFWPRDPGVPETDTAVELMTEPPSDKPVIEPGPHPYRMLANTELRLGSIVESLRRAKDLEPILHLGWRQPVVGKDDARAIRIQAGERYPIPLTREPAGERPLMPVPSLPEGIAPSTDGQPRPPLAPGANPAPRTTPQLYGTLRLTRGRYLHVYTDLLYTQPREKLPPVRLLASARDSQLGAGGDPQAPLPPRADQGPRYLQFRFQSHRRMRSGELHYLDHPFLGVLIRMTPYEVPETNNSP